MEKRVAAVKIFKLIKEKHNLCQRRSKSAVRHT